MMDGEAVGMSGNPMEEIATGDAEATSDGAAFSAQLAKEEKVKVLLVDDLPHKLTALSAVLENENLNLITATSGFDALRHLLREDFAVYVCRSDLAAGKDGGDGSGTGGQWNIKTANLPNDKNLSKGYSLGAVDYIYAPVVPEILKAKVAVFVELFRINRKVRQQARALRTYTLDLELVNRQLEHRTRELQSSKESFRNIVEKNQEGLAVLDAAGTIRFANPAFAGA